MARGVENMRVGSARTNGLSAGHGKGFSLVELLVVMVIIALLAAVAFPMFVKVKQSAQISECLSNMRQLGLGLRMYVDSYDNRFPAAVPWGRPGFVQNDEKTIQELLGKYVGQGLVAERTGTDPKTGRPTYIYPKRSVFTCPSDSGLPAKFNGTNGILAERRVWLQTGCSYEYYAGNQKDFLRWSAADPPEVPWTALSPEVQVNSRAVRVGAPIANVVSQARKAVLGDIWFWHLGDRVPPHGDEFKVMYTNTLFADGHARRVPGVYHLEARLQQLSRWHNLTEID